MNLHIDIGHPSDVHFFKHAIAAWQARGRASPMLWKPVTR